jgi:hypothetical protein
MAIDYATLIPLVTAGVGAAGQVAAARQQGREKQATQQGTVDQLNQNAHQTDVTAAQRGLEAKDAALLARAVGMLQENAAARAAPGERARTSVRGDILANAVDAKFNGGGRIPKFEFSGGLRPGMFSGNTRKLGGEMSRAALLDQMKGEAHPFADLPAADFSKVIDSKAPIGTALPEGGKLDSILGAIGQYGGMGAALANAPRGAGSSAAPIPAAQVSSAQPMINALSGNVMPPAPPPPPPTMLASRSIGSGMATAPRGY